MHSATCSCLHVHVQSLEQKLPCEGDLHGNMMARGRPLLFHTTSQSKLGHTETGDTRKSQAGGFGVCTVHHVGLLR